MKYIFICTSTSCLLAAHHQGRKWLAACLAHMHTHTGGISCLQGWQMQCTPRSPGPGPAPCAAAGLPCLLACAETCNDDDTWQACMHAFTCRGMRPVDGLRNCGTHPCAAVYVCCSSSAMKRRGKAMVSLGEPWILIHHTRKSIDTRAENYVGKHLYASHGASNDPCPGSILDFGPHAHTSR